jgi:hypothetical protein
MKYNSIRKYACVPFLILAVFLCSQTVPAADEITWKPVSAAELELKTPVVEADADAPGDVSDPAKSGSLMISMAFDKASGVLRYKRSFYFGANGKLIFPVNNYQAMRELFGEFHKADTHIVTLKQDQ